VFLGGDLVNNRKTIIAAIASGKEAAIVIDAGFRGLDSGKKWPSILVGRNGAVSVNCLAGGDRSQRQDHVVRYEELNTSYFILQERENTPRIVFEDRSASFHEVKLGISGAMAVREARRCFQCGLCDQCDNCHLFCPDVSVLRDMNAGSRKIDYDYCKGCGVCVAECPRNAMVLEEMPR
jgi:Pyruvate/2-oxoacid:ferredoxin oxidoreductase delta subunit